MHDVGIIIIKWPSCGLSTLSLQVWAPAITLFFWGQSSCCSSWNTSTS